jgi:hypothetical protein
MKRKHDLKLLATEMDCLRSSARISGMDSSGTEIIRTKTGLKGDMYQEAEEQKLRWYG